MEYSDGVICLIANNTDSALYGLQNRFMGGHDVIEMPYFLLNGGSMTKHNLKALQQRQEAYTQVLLVVHCLMAFA